MFGVLQPGETAPGVGQLQEWLREQGHQVQWSGVYDTETEDAVRGFQQRAGLPATGVWDESTDRLADRPDAEYAEQAAAAVDPADAGGGELSPDGNFRWDGQQWSPLTEEQRDAWFTDRLGAMAAGVLWHGDLVQFGLPEGFICAPLMAPVSLVGTGFRNGLPVCVLGDELPPQLRGPLPYTDARYFTPGLCTVTVMLGPDNMSLHKVGGRQVLLRGSGCTALVQVVQPAMMLTPTGPLPDPVMVKPAGVYYSTVIMDVYTH